MTMTNLKLSIKDIGYKLQPIIITTFMAKKHNRLMYTVYDPIFSKSHSSQSKIVQ